MKYFIFKAELGLPTPFIFGANLSHDQVANNLLNPHNWDEPEELKAKIISAGFVVLVMGSLACYGRSVTLDIKSRGKEDTKLINKMLGLKDD